MYFAYGWPRELASAGRSPSGEAVYISLGLDYLVIVFAGAIQIWTGGQYRVKIGELVRNPSSMQEEGAHMRAFWCPARKCLAVLTDNNHLLYYGMFSLKEALWRFPDGREVKKVSVYLQNSLHLDYGAAARVVDLTGDSKLVVAVLSSGALQVFSWQGQLRGQSNPFSVALEGSRGRMHRARSVSTGAAGSNLSRASSSAASVCSTTEGAPQTPSGALLNGSAAAAAAGRNGQPAATLSVSAAKLTALDAIGAADSPVPMPTALQELCVRSVHWSSSSRLLAMLLEDGRCALCRTPESGLQPVEQVHFFRWAYIPTSVSVGAVAAAINPVSQLLALGLAHGRVAIYTLQSLLSLRRSSTGSVFQGGGVQGLQAPDSLRVLSLTDWGYSSMVTGGASVLQWSPDGRVLAVGYSRRGMAVWTPSGCRLMCSLRQAAPAATPQSAALQPGLHGNNVPATPRPFPGSPTKERSSKQQPQQPQPSGSRSPRGGPLQQQQQAAAASSGCSSASSPTRASPLATQGSLFNSQPLVGEAGVLEGTLSSLCWGPQGYQLLMAERGEAGANIFEQDFARSIVGQHRAAPASKQQQYAWQGAVSEGGEMLAGLGLARDRQGVHALQGADRILVITENQPMLNPALAVPAAFPGAGAEMSQRPDQALQHVRVPQQYIESNYPLMHAAISQDRGDIAVAGTRGLAVYARRAQRWRMFGDVAQERQLRVHRLLWLAGGVVAVCAYVDSKEAGGAPQLLLYPRYHLDKASLLARMPLNQMPLATDSVGSYLLLAFPPLELRVMRVELEKGAAGTAGGLAQGLALTTLRELSIMGLGSPLQDIALVEPVHSLPPSAAVSVGADGDDVESTLAPSEQPSPRQPPRDQPPVQQPDGSPIERGGSLHQLAAIATRPAQQGLGGAEGGSADAARLVEPLHCVLLRAGGIMSLLNMDRGTEQILSYEIERFWLPSTDSAPAPNTTPQRQEGSSVPLPGDAAHVRGENPLASGLDGEESVASSSVAAGRWGREGEVPLELEASTSGQTHVEMPWWTYGARGMQLWFPSALSEPLTPLGTRSSEPLSTPTLSATPKTAPPNSTDPELEFDREVYPIGVSLAEVSIVGVTQRTVRNAAFPASAPQSLCFHPLPESQPVLPCLLRRLLQKGKLQDALELAKLHSGGPHFSRSLEWLLFTALELDSEQQREAGVYGGTSSKQAAEALRRATSGGSDVYSPRGSGPAAKRLARAGPLLMAAAQLVQQFPQYAELVVSVARKTDAQLWPSLFAAVGSPAELGEGLRAAGDLQSAACCLVIVDHIEGTAQAHALALRLIRAALRGGEYDLVAELLRFLVPPGESESLLGPLPVEARVQTPTQTLAPAQPAAELGSEGYGSWLWSLLSGGGAGSSNGVGAGGGAPAAGGVGGEGNPSVEGVGDLELSYTPVMDACRLIARHAWKLLDSGALRQLVAMTAAVAAVPGGLPTLMSSCGRDLPLAVAHMEASAAGVASALFVALNEFPSLDSDFDSVAAAESLLRTCHEAGCTNHTAALGLLLSDEQAVAEFEAAHPKETAELAAVLARDTYLSGFAVLLKGSVDGAEGEAARDGSEAKAAAASNGERDG